jgi:hypothetical protein
MDEACELSRLIRWHGFWIALLFLVTFILVLYPPLISGDDEMVKFLAGTFSGWFAAILGFYFLQGQTQQAAAVARSSGMEQGQLVGRQAGAREAEEAVREYRGLVAAYEAS